MTNNSQREARRDGYKCYQFGLNYQDNPYIDTDSDLADWWHRGWTQASIDYPELG